MKHLFLASACVFILPAAVLAQTADAPAGTAAPTVNTPPASPAPAASTATQAAVSSTAAPATADASDANGGEIIITATRRNQTLSNVPIAVSAVGQEALKNSGANDIRALNQLAPSLLVSSTGNEANGSARIRGIGTVGDNPGLESSVAVFIDGVYRSRTGSGLSELGEIERVEVLRGPQGTLFGRNASAGLINIVTAKPSVRRSAAMPRRPMATTTTIRVSGRPDRARSSPTSSPRGSTVSTSSATASISDITGSDGPRQQPRPLFCPRPAAVHPDRATSASG